MDFSNRTPIVAGNWKMNMTRAEAKKLIEEIRPLVKDAACEVALCVPFTDLETAGAAMEESKRKLGAQNCHWAASGAVTGEISAAMLAELGVSYVVIGHSERRQYFGETDQTVNARMKAALSCGLRVILCVGETLAQRESGQTPLVICNQVKAALDGITAAQMKEIVIAYEPVWAIGTGKTATAQQAGEVCALIRGMVQGLYNEAVADALRIQYGGSMNAKNAAELLAQYDIDGGLIGGASLKAPDFAAIVAAAKQ
ncbi:MAG: triose-phosphate isomerase [Oscillospiraceae bacterium]|nr:MAG: triose-phosphate isomerase [Oscillospiraceae bacterium]